MVADVATVAFGFMAPRTLVAIPVPQMAIWGLRCLTTLDPGLTATLQNRGKAPGRLSLTGPDAHVLMARDAPEAEDIAGWGIAVGQTARAAWDASPAVRRVGTEGVIQAFFDELFNHMDPYSRYAAPREADAEQLRRAGAGGVGLTLTNEGGGFVVAAVQTGGPAAQGGVRAGEHILAIGGHSTQRDDLAGVTALLARARRHHGVADAARRGRAFADGGSAARADSARDGHRPARRRHAGADDLRLQPGYRGAAGAGADSRAGRSPALSRRGAGSARAIAAACCSRRWRRRPCCRVRAWWR